MRRARVLCGSYNSKERGGAALLVIDNQNIDLIKKEGQS
jgi:hypothetical protein